MDKLTVYNGMRDQLQTGDCLLWGSNTILGWLIRKFTHAEVNHASVVVVLFDGTPQKRIYHVEALEKGPDLKCLSNVLRKYKGKVWWYPLKKEFDSYRFDMGVRALDFEAEDIGYDYWTLICNAWQHVKAAANKVICSEVWYFAVKSAVPLLDLYWTGDKSLLGKAPTPADIPKFDVFKFGMRIL